MASKARPGPHRDKREAKKEAKASKFRGVDHAVKTKAGVMAKPVNLVRYDMSDFLGSCVENYCSLVKVSLSSLKEVPTHSQIPVSHGPHSVKMKSLANSSQWLAKS